MQLFPHLAQVNQATNLPQQSTNLHLLLADQAKAATLLTKLRAQLPANSTTHISRIKYNV
jgi:hypothetical protein